MINFIQLKMSILREKLYYFPETAQLIFFSKELSLTNIAFSLIAVCQRYRITIYKTLNKQINLVEQNYTSG